MSRKATPAPAPAQLNHGSAAPVLQSRAIEKPDAHFMEEIPI
jgi:hypothetical protein